MKNNINKNNILWVIGQFNPTNGKEWDFAGIFDNEDKAYKIAVDYEDCFIAPVKLNEDYTKLEKQDWPGLYYPYYTNLNDKDEGFADKFIKFLSGYDINLNDYVAKDSKKDTKLNHLSQNRDSGGRFLSKDNDKELTVYFTYPESKYPHKPKNRTVKVSGLWKKNLYDDEEYIGGIENGQFKMFKKNRIIGDIFIGK